MVNNWKYMVALSAVWLPVLWYYHYFSHLTHPYYTFHIYIYDCNFATIVPSHNQTPNGAKLALGTILNLFFLFKFPWWRHQRETFFALLALCVRKGQWRGALMFSLICTWIKIWVNNREPGDLRCHRAHYDVTVMFAYQWFRIDFQ